MGYLASKFGEAVKGLYILVGAGIVAGCILFSSSITDRCAAYRSSRIPISQAETEADTLFDQFPTNVAGAKSIKKYGVRGSSHCLVHIRQTHFLSEGDWRERMEARNWEEDRIREELEGIEEKEKEVIPVLDDIEMIVGDLYEQLSMRQIYLEGTDAEEAEWFNEIRLDAGKKYLSLGDGIFEDARQAIGNELAEVLLYNVKASGGCKLEVRTTESKEILDEVADETIGAILDKGGDITAANSKREDFLLSQIASNRDKVAVTVFGGWHDWRDNVDNWNIQHPDNKFSLIEIVPKSYSGR